MHFIVEPRPKCIVLKYDRGVLDGIVLLCETRHEASKVLPAEGTHPPPHHNVPKRWLDDEDRGD